VAQLVTKFTEQNVTVLRNQANLTTNFLNDELNSAKANLDRLDKEMTQFRTENAGRLPDQLTSNLQAMNALESQLASVGETLNRNSQEKMALETRLQSLKSQLSFYANMATDSPSATVTQQQQRMVKNERLVELNKRIIEGESRLAALRELYKETYPDLRAATATLQTLKAERDILEKEEMAQMAQIAKEQQEQQASAKPVEVKRSLNPQMGRALEELKGEIASVETSIRTKDLDIKQRMAQQVDLHAKIQGYQNRIDVGPVNQQRYVSLMRDYDLAKEKYDEMSKRKSLSETATNMEDRKAGENLEVLDPASLPEAPTEPNRLIIAAIGTGIGFVMGVFLAGARELKDTSLKNLKDVRAYTNLAVLSSIPLLENALLVRRKRRLFWLAWTSAVIVGTIAMSGSMYYYYFGRS
jgi:polysaccharide biosynthesis transport protein